MAWFILMCASACEVVWALGLKYSDGFTKRTPTVITVIFCILSVVLLARAVKVLPLGTAYAIWTGTGAAGTVIASIFLFKESANWLRLACVAMIIIGVIGLNLVTNADSPEV